MVEPVGVSLKTFVSKAKEDAKKAKFVSRK
jgi:hypothetical protein